MLDRNVGIVRSGDALYLFATYTKARCSSGLTGGNSYAELVIQRGHELGQLNIVHVISFIFARSCMS